MAPDRKTSWPLAAGIVAAAALITYLFWPKPDAVLPTPAGSPPQDSVAAPNQPTKITVVQSDDVFLNMALYVAKDRDFFEQQGLDVQIANCGGDDKTLAAVISGGAQFGVADPTAIVSAHAKGRSGQVVANLVNSVPYWGVARKARVPEIKNPSQLKGFSVAVSHASSTALALQKQMFKSAGLRPNIRPGPPGELLAEVESGKADIALEPEPGASAAVLDGYRIVYSMADKFAPFTYTAVFTSDDVIRDHPDWVRKFLTAIELAHLYIHLHTDDVINVALKRFPSLERPAVERALLRLVASDTFPSTVVIPRAAWDKACRLRIASGELKASNLDARKSLNNTFADKVIADATSPSKK